MRLDALGREVEAKFPAETSVHSRAEQIGIMIMLGHRIFELFFGGGEVTKCLKILHFSAVWLLLLVF